MNSLGSNVYVHWYGKLLQGTVVNDNDLMGMVAVRIPLMGGHPVALFAPGHVYNSEEEAQHKEDTKSNSSDTWQAIQKFKEEHWNQERNHLRIDALEEFYQLWRTGIAAKFGVTIEETAVVTYDPGSPDGDHSSTYIVDAETDRILPELPTDVQQPQPERKAKMKVKLTKKQMRSTDRIEYADSIQTSFFN